MRALVAGFVDDGFTDEQARRLAVQFIAPPPSDDEDEQS